MTLSISPTTCLANSQAGSLVSVEPDPEKVMKRFHAHGLTSAEGLLMWEEQNGKCAIGGEALDWNRRHGFHIDHDHRHRHPNIDLSRGCRECVRGLLCEHCNRALSWVERPGWVNRALAYLARDRGPLPLSPGDPGRGPARSWTSIQNHGLTNLQWLDLHADQDWKCALCREDLQPGYRTNIDHDHDHCPGYGCPTCIRGLLCVGCNRNISYLERPGWLEAAVCYLIRTHQDYTGVAPSYAIPLYRCHGCGTVLPGRGMSTHQKQGKCLRAGRAETGDFLLRGSDTQAGTARESRSAAR